MIIFSSSRKPFFDEINSTWERLERSDWKRASGEILLGVEIAPSQYGIDEQSSREPEVKKRFKWDCEPQLSFDN